MAIWWILGSILVLIVSINLYVRYHIQFGARPGKQDLIRYSKSDNWQDGKFVNLIATTMSISLKTMPGLIKKQLTGRALRAPKTPIPIIPFDKESFTQPNKAPKFIWYGHSVLLLQFNGKNLLIDPMLGPDASPVGPFRTKRFSENSLEVIDSLPRLDAILLTHDHYDHLDLKSIRKLKSKTDTFFVGLGVGRHLERWGVPHEQITEFDWWQNTSFEGIEITYTPSRHFSGRGTTDRAKSLWGGWVFKSENNSIYWSGDGGYGEHFKEVGKRLGPFDIGFMECGQYNELWHQIHMYPEESVHAAIDAGAAQAVPVHWAGFTLAPHNWTDPIERFTAEAERNKYPIITPKIGEVVTLENSHRQEQWWDNYN